jgi:Heavy metal associated domain 2
MRLVEESTCDVDKHSFAESCSLKSRVPGRDRWIVPAITGDRSRALALETLLGSDAGIRRVSANELTGRILIEYSSERLVEPIERLIQRALEFGPMSPGEYAALDQPRNRGYWPLNLFLSAELGCLLFKVTFASVLCPGVSAAAGLAFAVVVLCRSRSRAGLEAPVAAASVGIEVDKAC